MERPSRRSRAALWLAFAASAAGVAAIPSVIDAAQATCGTNLLINGSFDDPAIARSWSARTNAQVPGWTASSGRHELWASGFIGINADGANLSELNYTGRQTVHQDIATTPGQVIEWFSHHRSRIGTDEMEVRIGSTTNQISVARGQMPRGEWMRWFGRYRVPAGQTTTRFQFTSISGGGSGNLIDNASVAVSCDQTSPTFN